MAEAWFIRVDGKEFGPADVETLREWKADGRVLPTNEARPAGGDLWITAAEIPELFEPPPVQIASEGAPAPTPKRTFAQLVGDSFRIYGRGFFQYLFLTLLVALPSVCAQLSASAIAPASAENPDLGAAVAGLFSFAMFVLGLMAWPIFITGIQIVTSELAAGHRPKVVDLLGEMLRFWPRIAGLLLFVFVVFSLLIVFGIAVLLMMLAAAIAGSLFSIIIALGLATLQIWLFCRFFALTLFWQQFAVLENLTAFDALRESSKLARSARNLRWYQRPLWRGSLIVSIWIAFVLAIAVVTMWPRLVSEWPLIHDTFNQMNVAQDPQAVLQKMMANLPKEQTVSVSALVLSVLQRILQPLLGIGFVLVYLDSRRTNQIGR